MTTKKRPGPQPGYTAEDIRAAIAEVEASGASAALANVRDALLARGIGRGSRGDSFRQAIEDEIAGHAEARMDDAIDRLPDEVVRLVEAAAATGLRSILAAVGESRARLEARADRRVEQSRRDVEYRDGELEALRDERAVAQARIAELETEAAEMTATIAGLRNQIQSLTGSLQTYSDIVDRLGASRPPVDDEAAPRLPA